MRLIILKTNFTTEHEWLFLLSDESSNDYYIMNADFYKIHGLKSPVTKHELDYYENGLWITATFEMIKGKRILVGS